MQNDDLLFSFFTSIPMSAQYPGTRIVTELGNKNCIELSNETTRVVLEPNVGGRVLVYALKGNNVLYINAKLEGTPYVPGKPYGNPGAGRFFYGPEKTGPRSSQLFLGKWEGKITGPREAMMTSEIDTVTGVRLVRSFQLDETGSHLSCTQVIQNASKKVIRHYHWSRTFAKGGGISLTPLNPHSKYPKGYLVYGPGNVLDFEPDDEPNVRTREGILEIIGAPGRPKFVMDCVEGWLAYITRDDQLFIKKFNIYPDRNYGDMAAPTVSVYYNRETMCEVEPIGPLEILEPGEAAPFTEHWYLYDFTYPPDRMANLDEVKNMILRSK